MSKHQDRILELVITADESDDSVLVTAVNFYRTRDDLANSTGHSGVFTADAAAGTHEIELGEVLPPPTHIRLTSTFQA